MQWRDLVAELDPKMVEAIEERTIERNFDRRTVVFREGDPPDGVYFVEEGRFMIEATTVEGAPVGLSVANPGEVFGAQSLLRPKAMRNATVFALRKSSVRLLRPREFERLRDDFPSIDRFFMLLLDERLRNMSDRLAEAVHATAEERVRRRLIELGDAFEGQILMSQQRLASLAGTTRPTVNRVLRQLEDEAVLSLGRSSITVHDKARL